MGTRPTARSHARRFWALALAVLLPGLGAAVIGGAALADGPGQPTSVTLQLNPSTISSANGSTTTATVTVKDGSPNPVGLPNQKVDLTANPGAHVTFTNSTVTTGVNGTATTTIKATGTAETDTIFATVEGTSHTDSKPLPIYGAPNSITLDALNPSTITANGTSSTTARAHVKDSNGNGVVGATVSFTTNKHPGASMCGQNPIGTGTADPNTPGDYTCTITSTMAQTELITASVGAQTSGQQTLTVVPGAPASVVVTFDAPTNTIVADGTSTTTATATVKDANGNPVSGRSIKFTTNGDVTFGGNGVGTDHNNGTYTVTITASTTADTETIKATDQGNNASGQANLTEIGNAATTSISLVVSPSSVHVSDGGHPNQTSTATATLKDAHNNPINNAAVTFKTDGDDHMCGANATSGPGTYTNQGNGMYTCTIAVSGTAGVQHITASANSVTSSPQPLTQYADASTLGLTLSPDHIRAGGTTHSTATAHISDGHGNGVPGQTVSFSTDGGGAGKSNATICSHAVDQGNGDYTCDITPGTTAGTQNIFATAIGATVSKTLTQFGPATTVHLQLTKGSITADGVDSSSASATVTDSGGRAVTDETVTFSTTGHANMCGSNSTSKAVTSNTNGVYGCVITTTQAEAQTIKAQTSAATNPPSDTAPLTATPGPAANVGVVLNPTSITADGVSTSTATATVTDAHGNRIKGDSVAFAATGGASAGAPTDNNDGTYTATVTSSTTAGQSTVTATDSSVNPSKAGMATLTMTPGPAASVALSLTPSSLPADGSSTSTAKATVTDAHGNLVTNETVTITTSGDAQVGTVTNNHDGTYTATITASKTADTETITAKTSNNKSNTAQLTENPGPAVMTLTLTPSSIPADGKSTSTATATVKDANGNPYSSETVTIATNGDTTVGSVSNNGNGVYSATITASTTADAETITASDSAKSLTKTATLTETVPSTYFPLTPARILDTRTNNTPLGQGETRPVQVAGQGGVPATGATAVVVNVTETGATANGFFTVYPSDAPSRPNASNLNFVAGETIPNLVMVKLGADGKVDIYNLAGSAHAIFDVVGYYGSGGARYNPLTPSRILDTRTNNVPLGQGETRPVQVAGQGGVPATGASAVVVNVTETGATANGFFTVYPSDAPSRPNASNLNFVTGETIPNLVVVKLGADGKVDLYNLAGSADAIFDVVGYYGSGGAGYSALTPSRILDTRTNNAPLGQGETRPVQVAGQGGVPATGATAVVVNVTETGATANGFFTVYPSDAPSRPNASNL
ncbi:MAG: Ig-like domain-containing protein, partial [Acidimicrobiia bacterium]|nr:Ig-like domain-containing protein [Acidimicrobiia bacterium]